MVWENITRTYMYDPAHFLPVTIFSYMCVCTCYIHVHVHVSAVLSPVYIKHLHLRATHPYIFRRV